MAASYSAGGGHDQLLVGAGEAGNLIRAGAEKKHSGACVGFDDAKKSPGPGRWEVSVMAGASRPDWRRLWIGRNGRRIGAGEMFEQH